MLRLFRLPQWNSDLCKFSALAVFQAMRQRRRQLVPPAGRGPFNGEQLTRSWALPWSSAAPQEPGRVTWRQRSSSTKVGIDWVIRNIFNILHSNAGFQALLSVLALCVWDDIEGCVPTGTVERHLVYLSDFKPLAAIESFMETIAVSRAHDENLM